jgi:predicted permease
MKHLRVWALRVAGLLRSGGGRERDLAAEIDSHLQLHIDDNLRAGMSAEEARRQARLRLGGVEVAKEAYRDRGTVPVAEHLLRDLRFSLRQLRKNPAFAGTAILLLALGMCASVSIFAFVDAALIKPLPYPHPETLVNATEKNAVVGRANLSYLDYLDWKKLNKVFRSLDVFTGAAYVLNGSKGVELAPGARVSDGFFRTLGVVPMLGRDFYAGEDLTGTRDTVILSYGTWLNRFGARKEVIGETVLLNGLPTTVIGVLPKSFQFVPRANAEFWSPLHAAGSCDLRRSCHNLDGIARLKDGVSVQTAQADAALIARQLENQYPDSNRGQGASVLPLSEVIVGQIRPVFLMLLAGAGLLLLIACVNVASLVLVRTETRKREIAVRGALGASSARIVSQFVIEGLVLVGIGSLLGLTAASWTMSLLTALIPKNMLTYMPYLDGLGVNVHVLAFAAGVALFAALVFSFTPILRVYGSDLRFGLADGSRGSAGTLWRRFGANLVVAELAIAVILLAGAGLLAQSLYRLLRVDLGFQPDHLAIVEVLAPNARYAKEEQQAELERQVVSRLQALPGVQSAAVATVLPVSFNGNTDWIRFPGRPYNGEHNEVNERDVSGAYFRTIKARLLRGRYFTDADDLTKPKVAIINQTLAKRYFPGEDPIGKKFGDTKLTPKSMKEIIGIVDDIKEGPLNSEIWPAAYYPFNQGPDTYLHVIVRTSQDEVSVLQSMTAALHQLDPELGTVGETTMSAKIAESAYLPRSTAWLMGAFAGVALLLGVVGLYGVIAYSVRQRTREIGVRMALGAVRRDVYGLVLKEAGRLTAAGIVAGLLCSLGAATLMRKLLFGVESWDVLTLLGVTAVLAIFALLASYLPARRAASVNPVDALRAE